jgi:hypothetical protein
MRQVMVPFPESSCHRCLHLRLVTSARGSTFLMCQEPSLPKYPAQPVRACGKQREPADP